MIVCHKCKTPYRATGGGWPLTKRFLDYLDYPGWNLENDVYTMNRLRVYYGIPSIFG